MNRVHSGTEVHFPEDQQIAVLIGEPTAGQRHIGIWHRAPGATGHVLHLAWHHKLKNDLDVPAYFAVMVAPGFLPRRLRQLATYCRLVWKRNSDGRVPYAFSLPNNAFDRQTGTYLVGPSRFGLTCASFVLAVFDAVSLPLIKYDTWPIDREGDREWQLAILNALEQGADLAHINLVRSEIGITRFRPEEVAAGAALSPPVAHFEDASKLGMEIVSKIHRGNNPQSVLH